MDRVLVLGLVFLCSFFTFPSMTNAAQGQALGLIFVTYCSPVTYDGLPGLQANFTNLDQSNHVVDTFFVWYNTADQVVFVGGQTNTNIKAGQTGSFINAYLVPGAYVVKTFVEDPDGNALSIPCPGNVTVP